MKWIVYLTTCIVTNKIYIGYHKTADPFTFDGYLGNGVYVQRPSSYKKSKNPFQYAVNKYGVDKFRRVTIAICDTKQEARDLEAILVSEEFLKRSDTYNVALGGEGGCPDTELVKIYMYDLDGKFVQEFSSAADCARHFCITAINGSSVLKAARLGQTLHGYQFSREKVPYMKKWTAKFGSHSFKRPVGKYDENGNLVKVYESTLAAKNDGYQNVAKALKYPERKCKGCYFRYLDENKVDKIKI